MAIYTGSPLGLVSDFFSGTQSSAYVPHSDGSTFEGGSVSDVSDSFFSSKHKFIKKTSSDNEMSPDPLSFSPPSIIHDSDTYDISTTNIIKILGDYDTMRLKTSDFVYCRNYGVFPNNRMVVCRRFPSPVGDDLTSSNMVPPNVSLVSWFSDQENPISFDFGERWTDAKTSLKDILNDIGKDILTAKIGDNASALVNAVPLPGMTEIAQRKILQEIGIISKDSSASTLPSGDPNLVIEAKQRSLASVEGGRSGIKGRFTVKVKCSWEQKFISGVDPTFIYYDILRTILEFGGSESTFYIGKNGLVRSQDDINNGLSQLQRDPLAFVSKYIQAVVNSLKDLTVKLTQYIKGDKVEDDTVQSVLGGEGVTDAVDGLGEFVKSLPNTIAKKYKIPILGIISSLSGAPSGFWHVTVGNPMRPILCSGDMICESVSVSLGPSLSFNDLPSTIECEFTLESARSLGINEIFTKLSSGHLRVVSGSGGDKYTIDSTKSPISFTNSDIPTSDIPTSPNTNGSSIQPPTSQSEETVNSDEEERNGTDGSQDETKVGNALSVPSSGDQVNPDPHDSTGFSTTGGIRFDVIEKLRNGI